MIWSYFAIFAALAVVLWAIGAIAAWKDKASVAIATTAAGLAVMLAYIVALWVSLSRPPMRTMGETRLWYSFFLPVAGVIVYSRWRYRWILTFASLLATVFVCINLLKPEIHSKTLMPALQSPWFAPHVIVYMMAYALMGAAFVMAVYLLLARRKDMAGALTAADNLVAASYAFLTLGMLMGALWAKEAWGHYWSWDPKETWAAVTWLSYLVYIHYRRSKQCSPRVALGMVIVSFCLLQMCWWGINYLPSAQATSIHTYSMGS